MKINNPANVISLFQSMTAKGPLLHSHVFDPELGSPVEVMEFEVSNGTKIPADLPFGLIAEVINPGNINKARLRVRVGPGFYLESGVEWPEVCLTELVRDNELETVVVCRKVVPLNSAIDSGEGIWESRIQQLDARHGVKITKRDPKIFNDREYVTSRADVVPERFKALRTTTEISETVAGTAVPPILAVGEELRAEQQLSPLAKRVTVRRLGESTNAELNGSQAYVEKVVAKTTESLLDASVEADVGLQVISSEVAELGNGQFVKSTVEREGEWPVLKGSRIDDKFGVPLAYTEQMVAPPESTIALSNTEYEPISEHRSLKRVIDTPVGYLSGYEVSYPVRVNMQLPKVLKSVTVVWNAASSSGDQDSTWTGFSSGKSYSLSCSQGDQASSAAAAIPEVIVDIEETWGINLPATGYVFYMPLPITESQILSRLGAQRWPVFKPRARTIVCAGQRVAVSVNVSISAHSSGSESSVSKDAGSSQAANFDVSVSNGVVQIPPTIHAGFGLTGDVQKTVVATATGSLSCTGTNFPTISANRTANISALAKVYPTSIPAVTGRTAIPTSGKFLIDSRIEPYKYGYALVYAEVLNASVFA